jgi:hypothetical protein
MRPKVSNTPAADLTAEEFPAQLLFIIHQGQSNVKEVNSRYRGYSNHGTRWILIFSNLLFLSCRDHRQRSLRFFVVLISDCDS